MSHGFELSDESILVGGTGAALVEVVAAQVVVGLAGGEQMPDDDQDRVSNGHRGTPRSPPSPYTGVLRAKVGVFGASSGMSGFDEGDAEPFGAVTGPPRAVLAGRLVVAWDMPAQLARCPAVGKRDMSVPISARITWALR